MKEFVISEAQTERAVLVGLITQNQNERKTNEYLDELAFLAETAGAEVVKRFTQKLDYPNTVSYVGKGKLQEIKEYLAVQNEEEETEIGMVIFDDELSAKQLRNIENELKVKILDRTSLILDIFAMRAQTANAKTQVELAQYKYMLPRLQRLWTHLERQGGGSGAGGGKGSVGLRGPGETQLEMDRRIILNRMALLKQRLADIDRQKTTQRKNRGRMIRVALVGYTNVGKSTLINLLAKTEVFAENKLFATLDTTVRKVIIDNLPFLLADTVGFIRKLPTDLVDSFKSTLDEVREADLLVHVVDVSHPDFEEQIQVVDQTEEEETEIGMVIFDDELSAKQLRNIENELKVKILDRTSLILDIFAMRAQTANAKTQVELAQYKYMLPRLQRLWTHLERQGGGSGAGGGKGSVGLRGPGETQLEMDRRIILNRMALLKQRLADIDRQKTTQRKNRGRMIRVALVGYTNVGKSTLINLLAKTEVFAENKLFATLDTTVRKVIIDNLPFLLADTVGFIRKLPTDLVDSFKSTLDEVREADLLVHVVDVSHPDFEEQIQVVDQTLSDLGCADKPRLMVFNKMDAYEWTEKEPDDLTPATRENVSLNELQHTWMARLGDDCIFISARERLNIDNLKDLFYSRVKQLHVQKYPYNDFLFEHYEEN